MASVGAISRSSLSLSHGSLELRGTKPTLLKPSLPCRKKGTFLALSYPAPLLRHPQRDGASVAAHALLPVDPWAPGASQSIASSLFAVSLFPYIGFLYFLTRSKTSPPITLFGFYFLLAFVGATIPAGIYAKIHYGTSLSNVDYLHGTAESLLTVTNLLIVLGLRDALRKEQVAAGATGDTESGNGSAASGTATSEEPNTEVQKR